MSWQACKHVWNNSKQTGGLKLTLLAIAEHATEKNGWTCCASIETLAVMVGVSDRQIKKNLTKLEELGELKIDRNIGRGNTNIYNISCLIKGELEDIKGEPQDTFYNSEKVNHSTEKVNSRVIKGELWFTQTNRTKKEPKEDTSPIIELAEYFEEKSGCYKPRTYTRNKWLDPLVELYKLSDGDFGKTKILIKDCVDLLVGNNYTVSTPASLLNTAKTMKSGHVNGKVNGNGRIHEPDEAGAAFEVAWNCAGRGRLDTEDETIKQAARTFGFARLRQWDVNFKSTAQKEFIGIYNDIKRKTTTAA